MREEVSFTAIVTKPPAYFHPPRLRGDESILEFLVLHYPDEWINFIERMNRKYKVSIPPRRQVKYIQGITDPNVLSELERWTNQRLPLYQRTFQGLAELRESFQKGNISLQVLWTLEESSNKDDSEKSRARKLGAEIIFLEGAAILEMQLGKLLHWVKGTLLWLVPGGSLLCLETTLTKIISKMNADPSVAVYLDGFYSRIYRVSAIKEVLGNIEHQSATELEIVKLLASTGESVYENTSRSPAMALCKLEKIYGGHHPFPKPPSALSRFKAKLKGT